MSRYIDADKFLDWLDVGHLRPPYELCFSEGDVKDMIDQRPTADVVEVVRCKDCKKRYVPHYCALWHSTVNGREIFLERGDNFFCSHGERKEKEE